jgi:hypothetical protein
MTILKARESRSSRGNWGLHQAMLGRMNVEASMRARWTEDINWDRPPIVGQTIVASFWPGLYYLVATIELDSSSPMSRLTQSLSTGDAYDDVVPEPNGFMTDVVRCDKMGFTESFENPLYEREYSDLDQAKLGHREIVELLSKGHCGPRRLHERLG